jgi:outer membrane protein assembly factor BamD
MIIAYFFKAILSLKFHLKSCYSSALMRHYLTATAALFAVLSLGACSSTPKTPQATEASTSKVDADEQVLKQDPLERNYDPHVIMKRAEAFFEKEDYAEAGVEYQHFLDLHKTHVLAPYAQYRLSLSHFKQASTRDRDPEPIRRAMDGMDKLLKDYPGNTYEQDARSKVKECREHLASYELYVGKHYYRQTAYLAAIHRFQGLLRNYPDSEAFTEAAYYLGRTYADLGANNDAIEYLTQLLRQHPKKDKITQDSAALLAKLTRRPVKEIMAASVNSGQKTAVPAPLPTPNGKVPSPQIPALLPTAGVGLPQDITCGLNVSC